MVRSFARLDIRISGPAACRVEQIQLWNVDSDDWDAHHGKGGELALTSAEMRHLLMSFTGTGYPILFHTVKSGRSFPLYLTFLR